MTDPAACKCPTPCATAICVAACVAMIAERRIADGLDTDGSTTLGRFRWHARRIAARLGGRLSFSERRRLANLARRIGEAMPELGPDRV